MAEFLSIESKSILNVLKRIDSWFWCRYSINPYRGCQYGCHYCNSRSDRYHLQKDFHSKIYSKTNGPDLLYKRLSRARTLKPDVVVFSGVTDAYQSIETKERLTRRLLEVLLEFNYPVHIITKSPHVLQDMDIIEKIAAKSWAAVSVSIPHYDKAVVKQLDFRAPPLSRRMAMLRELGQSNCHNLKLTVLAMPTLLTSWEEPDKQIQKVCELVKESSIHRILFSGLSLSPGQREYFVKNINRSDLNTKLEASLKEQPRHMFKSDYNHLINSIWNKTCASLEIETRLPRFIPEDYRGINYKLAEVLSNTAYARYAKGQNGKSLSKLADALEKLPVAFSEDFDFTKYLVETSAKQRQWLEAKYEEIKD